MDHMTIGMLFVCNCCVQLELRFIYDLVRDVKRCNSMSSPVFQVLFGLILAFYSSLLPP